MAYLDPRLEPYSPILLQGFDEEEYFNRPIEGEEDMPKGTTEVAEAEAEQEAVIEEVAPRAEGGL